MTLSFSTVEGFDRSGRLTKTDLPRVAPIELLSPVTPSEAAHHQRRPGHQPQLLELAQLPAPPKWLRTGLSITDDALCGASAGVELLHPNPSACHLTSLATLRKGASTVHTQLQHHHNHQQQLHQENLTASQGELLLGRSDPGPRWDRYPLQRQYGAETRPSEHSVRSPEHRSERQWNPMAVLQSHSRKNTAACNPPDTGRVHSARPIPQQPDYAPAETDRQTPMQPAAVAVTTLQSESKSAASDSRTKSALHKELPKFTKQPRVGCSPQMSSL